MIRSCLNGGRISLDDRYCICDRYFGGEYCEDKECVNGGTLHLSKFKDDNLKMFPDLQSCDCPDGFFGQHCQFSCFNGGTLRNQTCLCQSGYFGSVCEKLNCSHDRPSTFNGKETVCNCGPWYGGMTCAGLSMTSLCLIVSLALILLIVLICCVVSKLVEKRKLSRAADRNETGLSLVGSE